MAVAQGYGKTVTSGSVFAYDVTDFRNSYKGKPGYNVTGTPVAWVGNNNTSDFKTTIGTTTINIPAIGTREVYYVDIWNTGASNCCPSLFRYGDWGTSTGVAGNTLYTYSIIYKCKSGYTHPNFMYRYEFNGGSYITEVGVFDTAKRIDLGDGWYQAYNTFTTNASTNTLYLGMWYYQYNVYDTVYLYKASLTQGDHVFSPEQIIPPYTTRSTSQGLLPLVGSSTLDLTNMSFDSNAQMTFDGTNDVIALSPSIIPTSQITVEFICTNNTPSNSTSIIAGGAGNQDFNIHLPWSDGNVYWDCGNPFNRIYKATTLAERSGIHHWVFTKNPSTGVMCIYLDGTLWHTDSGATSTLPTLTQVSLGAYNSGGGPGYYYSGTIPVFKLYNRALSAAEVRQNYLHYKTRFNLS